MDDNDLTHPGVIAQEVIDLNGYGAIPPGAAGSFINTNYATGSTITLPSTTITNGGYTINGSTTVPYTWTTGGAGAGTSIYTSNNISTTVHIDGDGLTMKEGADIKIGGKSLKDSIEKIEERLGILKPNPELEDRWDKLKELRQQYIELEKDLLEKEKIMKILKEK